MTNPVELPNPRRPEDDILSGGQLTPDALRAAAEAGYATILNMRAPGEMAFDEAALVAELGMTYVSLPIRGPGDLTAANAEAFDAALGDAARPMIVHCGSGNRVGALFALRAAFCQGASAADALAIGREAGLTGMEPAVRDALTRGA
jgi:uncharacterized protein (TIGR01244 family)